MSIQAGARLFQSPDDRFQLLSAWTSELPGASDFFQHGALVRFVTVKFEAECAKPCRFQPPFYHFQRGELFRDKQHFLSVEDSGGDEIGDGLALARARRTLDDYAAASAHHLNSQRLRTVRIDDVIEPRRRDEFIEMHILGKRAISGGKPVAQQPTQSRQLKKPRRIGPTARIEIAIHQKLCKGEEAERHRVRFHFPSRLSRHCFSYCRGVLRRNQFFLWGELRQFDAELGFEL